MTNYWFCVLTVRGTDYHLRQFRAKIRSKDSTFSNNDADLDNAHILFQDNELIYNFDSTPTAPLFWLKSIARFYPWLEFTFTCENPSFGTRGLLRYYNATETFRFFDTLPSFSDNIVDIISSDIGMKTGDAIMYESDGEYSYLPGIIEDISFISEDSDDDGSVILRIRTFDDEGEFNVAAEECHAVNDQTLNPDERDVSIRMLIDMMDPQESVNELPCIIRIRLSTFPVEEDNKKLKSLVEYAARLTGRIILHEMQKGWIHTVILKPLNSRKDRANWHYCRKCFLMVNQVFDDVFCSDCFISPEPKEELLAAADIFLSRKKRRIYFAEQLTLKK